MSIKNYDDMLSFFIWYWNVTGRPTDREMDRIAVSIWRDAR